MIQPLPYAGFKWIENPSTLDWAVEDDAEVGYLLEVDLDYPQCLHDLHSDLPFCAESRVPPHKDSKQRKLLTTLLKKERYVIHYRALKQALKYGLKLLKIHRVLEFKQKPWLKPYIDENTAKRAKARNEFEKYYYKLKNNAVFGKTMEDERKRKDVRLVSKWGGRYGVEALIGLPNFHSVSIFHPNLVAIQMLRQKITIRKPKYVGQAVLDLSKTLMYEFHYGFMLPKIGKKHLKLLYMDTDSFLYHITGVNVYKFMRDHAQHFDTSDYPTDNVYGIEPKYAKIVGLFKDELNGCIIFSFVGLRSKMYAIHADQDKIIKRIKGVKSSVVQKTITFEDFLHCLLENEMVTRDLISIRSRLHILRTERETKTVLNPHDDKRYLMRGNSDTLPWGHYKIQELESVSLEEEKGPPKKKMKMSVN